MTPFERACRALCNLEGNPENIQFGGKPMWRSYAPEVQAVIDALAEPHAPMVNAAVREAQSFGPKDFVGIWRAMIGAVDG